MIMMMMTKTTEVKLSPQGRENMTRFTFIRAPGIDAKHRGAPVGGIAYRTDLAKGRFEYEVSASDPKLPLDRQLLRNIAVGRLDKHPKTVEFDPATPPSISSLLRSASVDMIAHPDELHGGHADGPPRTLPKRFIRALTYHLREQDAAILEASEASRAEAAAV